MADLRFWKRRKRLSSTVSVVRIDDFKKLTEEEQVERVKEMLRSLGKPGGIEGEQK